MKVSKEKIECRMVNVGLTPPELAAVTGISQEGIARIKARGSCRISNAIKLCNALNCTIEEISPEESEAKT